MDIKERIDGLTEQEAKAALGVMLSMGAYDLPCECCEVYRKYGCGEHKPHMGPETCCMNKLLDEALKEANRVAGY